ncbi:LysM peptidoglycan-binding domain-containing protein [Nevskia sp.]|uniref:LysM peptidoglycan-binding domain-containing protein n=1 Tax=Nevskia sp. TaxID=1929292 RepID=UPI0025D2C2EC|nr:LysM peptidoglycan-binding domain-containing protein [Nevskia sp.]
MYRKPLILVLLAAFAAPLAAAETTPPVPGAAAAAAVGPAPVTIAEDPAFPTPAILKPRVAFWKKVFADWSEHNSVLHDKDNVSKVFRVLDFRADAAVLAPNALAAKKKREETAARIEVDAVLRALQAKLDSGERINPDQLPLDEAKIYAAYHGDTDPKRFAKAADGLRYQRGLRERTNTALEVSGRYLPEMERIFSSYGLPTRLTRLPLVESSFNVEAYSKAAAAGLWQFIPSSARIYMRLDNIVDDRRDPWTSTDAAARHLRDDFNALGSWPLALTAYNHGRGGVAKGLRTVGGSSLTDLIERYDAKSFGFASSNFYAEFLAASEIERDYRNHFGDVQREPALHFDTVLIRDYVPYDTLRKLAGADEEEFRRLNPAYRPPVVDGKLRVPAGHTIRVPAGSGQRFDQAYASLAPNLRYSAQAVTTGIHVVKRGESLARIARRYRVSTRELLAANDMANGNKLKAGARLQVPIRDGSPAVEDLLVASAPTSDARPLRVKAATTLADHRTHRVRSGQTLGAIAMRYSTSIKKIREINGFGESEVLRAGATIKVPRS